jgi:hypothetical protein
MEELDTLLYEQALLQVKTRRLLKALRRPLTSNDDTSPSNSAKFFVYVLSLQNGKFYIGASDNIYTRLMDHELQSPSSSCWVRQEGPVARVVDIIENCDESVERNLTLYYMLLFGAHNVRGSYWSKPALMHAPHDLAAFDRACVVGLKYLSRDVVDAIHKKARSLCMQCST